MSRARVSAARPAERRRSTSGPGGQEHAPPRPASMPDGQQARGQEVVQPVGQGARSRMPTRRSSTAWPARHSGRRGRSRSKRSVSSTSRGGDHGDADDARHEGDDGRAQRRSVRRGRELLAVHDQEGRGRRRRTATRPTSPPRTRCSTSADAQGPLRRWPRPGAGPAAPRGPGPAGRCPTRATRAPAAWVATKGRSSQHEMEPAPQRRRHRRLSRSTTPGHGDGARRPAPDPAGPAAHGAEVRGRVATRPRGGRRPPPRDGGRGPCGRGPRPARGGGRREAPTGASSSRAWSSAPVSSSTQASCRQCQEHRQHARAGRGAPPPPRPAAPGAGEEPGAEMGELGLQRGAADEARRTRRRTGPAPRRAPASLAVAPPAASASSKSPSSRPPPRVRHALRATHPSTTGQDDELDDAHHRRRRAAGSPSRRGVGALMARDGRGWSEDEMVEARGHEGEAQDQGDGEGHEQPPAEAGEAAVEKARGEEAWSARRVGQPVEAVLPRRRRGPVTA